MFCTKCGTKNEDNAKFCTACGANLQEEQPVAPAEPVDSAEPVAPVEPIAEPAAPAAPVAAKMEKSRLVGLIAIAAAAVVVVILAIILFCGRSPKAVAKKYVKAFFAGNEKSMSKLFHRKELNEMLDDADLDKDELDELFDLEWLLDFYEDYYGEDWEYSFKIKDIDDVSKRDLKELKEYYDDEFDLKVTAAKTVEVDIEIEGEEDDDEMEWEVTVIKIGGSWYLGDW